MPLFAQKEKDRTNAYLAAAGALAALPTAEYASRYLVSDVNSAIREARKSKGYTGEINYRNLNRLKSEILQDSDLANNLHVLKSPSPGTYAANILNRSAYIPGVSQSTLEDLIKNNKAFMSADGSRVSVSDIIKGVRNTGGYIHLNSKNSDVIDLAHELGHARALSTSSKRYGPMYNWLQNIGRTNPLVLAGAASAASLLQDDADSPYAYAPAAVVAATQIPILREEYIASKKGYNALKNLQRSGLVEKGTANLARNKYLRYGGTYLAGALGATAIPALVALSRQRYGTDVPVIAEARENLSGISPTNAGLVAGGALLGGAALAKYGPTARYLDDLIGRRMSKGKDIDEAVSRIKKELSKKS
jgi:hypothetical protein